MTPVHTHFTSETKKTVTRLRLSLGLTALFVVVELAAGWFANSLALLTDAAHNFTDVIALALAGGSLTSRSSLRTAAKPLDIIAPVSWPR